VWIGDEAPDAATMQRIATEVGFSETAFLAPQGRAWAVRYFSPAAEVPFCGHATIAAGIVLAELHGEGWYDLRKADHGSIEVLVRRRDGARQASLWSEEPAQSAASDELVNEALQCLGWRADELDAAIPPVRAFAGAWHLILAAREAARLACLDYDFERLRRLMQQDDLTTLQLIWRQSPTVFVSRNPFPVGGVVEDPATGAAAAALGGYLRALSGTSTPDRITIRQGEALGRPSIIDVRIPSRGRIVVTGTAHHLDEA
jgi:PhzF family phenazine biosynthesis protein